jgi:signal peptidase I
LARALRSVRRHVIELAVTLVVAVAVVLVIEAFAVKPFWVPTSSMAATIMPGDHVLIDRIGFHFERIHRGDIVVFTGQGPVPLLKRVVGLPGDLLVIRNGRLLVNGRPASQRHVRHVSGHAEPTTPGPDAAAPWSLQRPFVVPPGQYYVMGDNRTDSDDSRFWGTVLRSQIIGRVFLVYWPPAHLRGL